jgi:hypothetical protein
LYNIIKKEGRNMFGFKDDDENKPIKPISFLDKEKDNAEKPVGFMDTEINSDTSFAITKLTMGGKFVRGKMLFFKLNGVEIYTDINNVIFVDKENNTVFVRESEKVIKNVSPSDPEEKQYILLYTDLGYGEEDSEEIPLRWEAVVGRTPAYENIKVNAAVIDIDKSLVLVDNVPVNEALTIRQFVNYIQNANYVEYDGFEIDSYTGSDYN